MGSPDKSRGLGV